MQRATVLLMALLTVTVGLAGCVDPDPADGDGNESGDDTGDGADGGTGDDDIRTYAHVTQGEPDSLDPAVDYETAGGTVLQQVYQTLIFYDGTSAAELAPVLAAELPEESEDGLTYTFTLREGVTFHDGTALGADDVKFSLDRMVLINDPDGPAWIYQPIRGAEAYFGADGTLADRLAYLAAGGVEIVDDMTVAIHLDYADPAFPYRLAFTAASIISKDAVCENAPLTWTIATSGMECIPPPGETKDPWADENTAGTGPFMLERWVRDQFVELARYDDYWGEAAKVDKVLIQKVEDFNTRLLMLQGGDADSIYVASADFPQLAGRDNIQTTENPSWVVDFVGFNQAFCGGPEADGFDTCMDQHGAAVPKGVDGTADPMFFRDANMREAWVHAFDYATFYSDILNELGVMLNGPLPQGIFGYDESIPRPSRDLEAAREALARSDHPDGFEITLFYNTGNTRREQGAQLLAQNLEELHDGISVDVQGLDWASAYLPLQRAKALPVFFLGWAPDYGFPDNYVVTFAHSERGIYAKRMAYENPELNTLLDEAVRETDRDELATMYSDAVKMVNADNAFLWLGQLADVFVSCPGVQGHYYNPMYSGNPGVGDYQVIEPC